MLASNQCVNSVSYLYKTQTNTIAIVQSLEGRAQGHAQQANHAHEQAQSLSHHARTMQVTVSFFANFRIHCHAVCCLVSVMVSALILKRFYHGFEPPGAHLYCHWAVDLVIHGSVVRWRRLTAG